MLSFELSAIDVVLAIAIVVILLLYMMKLSQPGVGPDPSAKQNKLRKDIGTPDTYGDEKIETSSQTNPSKCSHYFGYLNDVDVHRASSIPEECYTCPQMIQCTNRTKE